MSNTQSKTASKRVIQLTAVCMLLLATMWSPLLNHSVGAQSAETIEYAESGTAPVAAYTAVDPEGELIVWQKSGDDQDDFTIVDGVLKFSETPDFENPEDSGADNSFSVTVSATDGTLTTPQSLTINIVNLEERGTVTLSTRQPREGIELTAKLVDPDGGATDTPPISTSQTDLTDDATWQWERSRNGSSGWTIIEEETSNSYTPSEDDVGAFLRVIAKYNDGQGEGKDARMVSANAVDAKLYRNEPPVFQDADGMDLTDTDRSVAENSDAGTPVGEPIKASDDARDVLTYSLDDTSTNFAIESATGLIRVAEGASLDYDTQPISYTVTVTATDPSNEEDTITVTINITDVDETPVVTVSTGTSVRSHTENARAFDPVALFEATNPETAQTLMWSLSGPDRDIFDIDSSGMLTFESEPDFEAPGDANRNNVYEVTVQSTDSGANTGSLDVTVTVTNVDEEGTVTLSNRQPEDGTPITAMLTDPDDGVSGVTWQWADDGGDIDGATSASFTPTNDQVGETLTATASYTDGHGAGKSREGQSANDVQARNTSNTPPEFQDGNGQAISSVDRSVEENTVAGTDDGVGDPATAEDPDTGELTYSLEGSDAGLFKIDADTGQIRVGSGTRLDFETRKRFSVRVKVKDAQNAPDTVTVNITVTDQEEDPEITSGPMTVDYAEKGTGTVATYTATDPEDDSARPRMPLSWTLPGNDGDLFTIEGGMLKFKTTPDFEDERDQDSNSVYQITVTVTDSAGRADAQQVMVKVTNVEETGTVTLSAQQPQEGVQLTATLADQDEIAANSETWQWERSRSRNSGWTVIEVDTDNNNPNTNMYAPRKDDVGYYLRATSTYKDGESGETTRSAQGVSTHAVRKKPYRNVAPVFQDAEDEEIPDDQGVERSVKENSRAGTAIGDPVAATDEAEFGPDTLTYTLGGTDASSFDIDSESGQIRVKAGVDLDYEDQDNQDHQFEVTVTATDPSHIPGDNQNDFSDSLTVTILVTDVEETPEFTAGPTAVEYNEDRTDAVGTYEADDPEDDSASPQKPLTWSMSGVDGNRFSINSTNGALTFTTSPDYEAPVDSGRNNVYNVTVEVTDSGGNTATRVVTVTVVNTDESGVVTLSNVQPEDGVDIEAELDDPDDRISDLTWQWAKTSGRSPDPTSSDHIEGAASATYTPVAGDVGDYLWAIASYRDGQGSKQDRQHGIGIHGTGGGHDKRSSQVCRPGH